MNRKAEIFFDAITLLPEDMIEEAQEYRFRKSRASWKRFASLAACLMLVASLSLLAALPKGCGGGAPGPDFNTSPSGSSGDSAPPRAEATPDGAPQDAPASSETVPDGGVETARFTARVLEVKEDGAALLVEPLEGEAERGSADRIVVTVNGEVPPLAAGDLVRITYDGMIQETYPAGISGAVSIEKLDKTE